MGIQLKKGNKPGRNEPCVCGSGLKMKKCHGDQLKIAICNRVANEKMAQLIKEEQFKKIIRMQQEECALCDYTGKDDDGTKCRSCQFVTDEDRIKYEYELSSKGENNEVD